MQRAEEHSAKEVLGLTSLDIKKDQEGSKHRMSAANGHVTYIQYNSTANWRLWLGLEQRQTAPFFFFMVSCCFPWQVERLRSELRVSKPKLPAETLAKLEELRAEAADIERDLA